MLYKVVKRCTYNPWYQFTSVALNKSVSGKIYTGVRCEHNILAESIKNIFTGNITTYWFQGKCFIFALLTLQPQDEFKTGPIEANIKKSQKIG